MLNMVFTGDSGTHFPSSLSELKKNLKWHLKIFNFSYHVFMEGLCVSFSLQSHALASPALELLP